MRIHKFKIHSLLLSPHAAIVPLLLASIFPVAARATDLTLSIEGQAEYDSNALRRNGQEDDDVLFRFRPGVKLHEDRGQDLSYSLFYAVPFEFAVDNGDELDDIDHEARGSVRYHVNDRMELFAGDNFRYLRGALRDVAAEDVVAGDGTVLINQERDRITLNDANAGISYRFTPRLSGQAAVSHSLFDSQRPDRADNWLLEGVGSMSYLVTPKHNVGLGFRYLRQEFDDRDVIPGSTVNSYNVFAQWTYRISETLQFEIAAGPTLIDVQQDDPDASLTTATVPFVALPGGFVLDGTGLVFADGSPATGTALAGDVVVAQLDACPQIVGTMTQVIPGDLCGIPNAANATPTTAGVYLEQGTQEFTDATATTTVTDPAARGDDETRIDVFALAVLRKDWTENLHTAIRYERTQGDASGLGGAVVGDYASLSNTWDFAERWQLALRGDWTLRQSVSDSGVSQYIQAGDPGLASFGGTTPAGAVGLVTIRGGNTNEIDTMRYGVAGRLTHRFTRNTSGWVQLTYNEQTSSGGTLGNASDFDDFLAAIGVRHVFEPIKLW